MNFINNIMAKTKATTNKAAEFINTDKIRWISIGKITVDPEIKAIFNQNETEILNISEDMKVNGYNAGNPATVSQDNVLVEGHTRFIAAQRAGLKKIAVVTKHFNSKQEMLEYAYKQQLHRRNLSEQDIFNAYKKLRELTNPDGKKAKTDVEIAEELHVSPRQIAKMKEVEKKASEEVMSAFNEGSISLNQAYNQMKEELKPKTEVQVEKTQKKAEPEIRSEKTSDKVKKNVRGRPAGKKLELNFRSEDFNLIQNAADAANLSVSEYVMNIVMSSVQVVPAETVSEKKTA